MDWGFVVVIDCGEERDCDVIIDCDVGSGCDVIIDCDVESCCDVIIDCDVESDWDVIIDCGVESGWDVIIDCDVESDWDIIVDCDVVVFGDKVWDLVGDVLFVVILEFWYWEILVVEFIWLLGFSVVFVFVKLIYGDVGLLLVLLLMIVFVWLSVVIEYKDNLVIKF